MSHQSLTDMPGINVSAKLTAVRTDKDEKKGFDVVISTPSKKSPVKASFPGNAHMKEMTQTLLDVDPTESITVHLFDQESKEEVKTLDVPIKDLQSNLTSTHLFHDGITVLIEYEITRDGKKIVSTDDKLDELINIIGFGEKPWYLETATLYSTVKLTLMRIFLTATSSDLAKNPQASAIAQTVINFLKSSTEVVKSLTLYKKLFSQAEAEVLIEQLDTYIASGLEQFDFLADHLRSQLADALSELRFAIIHHVEWIKDASKTSSTTLVQMTSAKISDLQVIGTKFVSSAKEVLVLFKEPKGSLNILIMLAVNYYNATKTLVDGKVKELSKNGKILLTSYLDKKFTTDSTWTELLTAGSIQATQAVLIKAQPYVHKAVTWTTPLLIKVLSVSKPYLIKAAPYAVVVADNFKRKVESNASAEKILKVVTTKGFEALEVSTAYVIPEPLADTYDEIFTLKSQ